MTQTATGNAAWDRWNPAAYAEQYTAAPRAEDLIVAAMMRKHFAGAAGHGVDVGTGSNLYPALAMLEHCRTVSLTDYSAANYEWLCDAVRSLSEKWRPFAEEGAWYARERMRRQADVVQVSIFDLPRGRHDLGTMCHVAESITDDRAEFGRAVRCFVGCLRPGAPYVATFSHMSHGYEVDGVSYPAVPVRVGDVYGVLAPLSGRLDVELVREGPPLRDGWSGIVVARGWAR